MKSGKIEYVTERDGNCAPVRPICYIIREEPKGWWASPQKDPPPTKYFFIGGYGMHEDTDKKHTIPPDWIQLPEKQVRSLKQFREGDTYPVISLERTTRAWETGGFNHLKEFWLPPDPWDLERMKRINPVTASKTRAITKDGLLLQLDMPFSRFCTRYLYSTAKECGSEMITLPGGHYFRKEDIVTARMETFYKTGYLIFEILENKDIYRFTPFYNRCSLKDPETGVVTDLSPVIRLKSDGPKAVMKKLDWLQWTREDGLYVGRRKDGKV